MTIDYDRDQLSYALANALKERDEARHEIEGWRNKWDCAVTMGAKAENERDEALHKLEICMAANSDVARIARERDEAIAQNAKLRDIADGAIKLGQSQ